MMPLSNKISIKNILLSLVFAVTSAVFIFYMVLYLQADTNEQNNCAERSKGEQVECVVDEIVTLVKSDGITSAIEHTTKLFELYPEVRNDCHGIMHAVGEEAYLLYLDSVPLNISSSVTMCTYGFYHGFINAAVRKEGNFTKARELCEYINLSLSEQDIEAHAECYHGFGHAVVDDHVSVQFQDAKTTTSQALILCNELSEVSEQYINCASGVFNAVSNIFIDKTFAWPEIEEVNSFSLCNMQQAELQQTCFGYFARVALDTHAYSLTKAIEFIKQNVIPEHQNSTIENVATMVMIFEPDKSISVQKVSECNTVSSSQNQFCISGLAVGVLQSAPVGLELSSAASVCTDPTITAENQLYCFERLFDNARTLFSKTELNSFCATA